LGVYRLARAVQREARVQEPNRERFFSFMSADTENESGGCGVASAAAARDKRDAAVFVFARRNANLRSGKVRQRSFSL
jgi:hypothetical protein